MNNLIIRTYLMRNGLKHYKAAEILGMSETKFSRELRKELPRETQEAMIQKIEAKKGSVTND